MFIVGKPTGRRPSSTSWATTVHSGFMRASRPPSVATRWSLPTISMAEAPRCGSRRNRRRGL